jgi:hypothetical protein
MTSKERKDLFDNKASGSPDKAFWVVHEFNGSDQFVASFERPADANAYAAERTQIDSAGYVYRVISNPQEL